MIKGCTVGPGRFWQCGAGFGANITSIREQQYTRTLELNIKIVAVADALKGNVYNPQGVGRRRPAGKSGVRRQPERFFSAKSPVGMPSR